MVLAQGVGGARLVVAVSTPKEHETKILCVVCREESESVVCSRCTARMSQGALEKIVKMLDDALNLAPDKRTL